MRIKVILLAIISTFLYACNDKEQATEPDNIKIEKYVAANNLNTTIHPSGIHYLITQAGAGPNPTGNAKVTVKYKGYFLNGTIFDQNTAGVEFPLTNLIEGWKIAIPLLNKGAKGTFIMPSALCYGSNPPPGIPANEVLAFEIELIDFKE